MSAANPMTGPMISPTNPTAVLLMAYGTPASPADIEAYYTDIRRGRPPSPEQLADLTARYDAIGGTSPLAAVTEAQRVALQAALHREAPGEFVVVQGLKHAEPKIEVAVGALAAQGCEHVIGLVLAPHYSAYSVGQYLDRARAAAEPHDITVTGVQSWATEPAFVQFVAADLKAKLANMPADTRVVFTAHSLPQRIIAGGDPYPAELTSTAEAVAAELGRSGAKIDWTIAWQSAGRTPEPWLGPDILEVIDDIAAGGDPGDAQRGILVSAVGFVADHLEVLYDLDIEAAARAAGHGVAFARTKCVNDDPTVMTALAHRVIAKARG